MSQEAPRNSQELPRKPGRPRSERAKQAILTATADVLLSDGLRAVTAEGIAARAGVSKATLYKWWPSKATAAVDAFLMIVQPQVADPDTGDLAQDLAVPALAQIRLFRDTRIGFALASLVAEAQNDPEVAAALRDRWLAPRRAQARLAVVRARERGEIRDGIGDDFVLDLVFGPVYYRLLLGHGPLDESLVLDTVDVVVRGVRR
jgi:AcrR family transcriptional regulator